MQSSKSFWGVLLGPIVIASLAACSSEASETSTSASHSAPEPIPSASPKPSTPVPSESAVSEPTAVAVITVDADNLAGALDATGLECVPVDDYLDCDVGGESIAVIIPSDWAADEALRQRACDEGYINLEYTVVGDGATWYAATDYDEASAAFMDALAAAGYETSTFPYCPA